MKLHTIVCPQWFNCLLQELRAQPQESGPGVSPQEEEAAAHLHLHHPPPCRQEMPVIPADQVQRHGDHSLLHPRSGRQGRPSGSASETSSALQAVSFSSLTLTSLCFPLQLHYNSKTLKTDSPNASRGSSLPRTLSKESKLYGMKDSGPPNPPNAVQSRANSLLPPPPPPIPSGTERPSVSTACPTVHALSPSRDDFTATLGATQSNACHVIFVRCSMNPGGHRQSNLLMHSDGNKGGGGGTRGHI